MKSTKKSMKRWASGVMLSAIAVTAVTGCAANGGDKASAGKEGGSAAQGPLELSIMLPAFKPTFPKDGSPVVAELEKYTNTKIHLDWVPDSSYADKINITLASGKLPTVMVIKDKTASFINAARSGAFWEVGPYLKDYPNLSKANPIVNNNISVDGKIYGIYRARPLGRNGIVYRKEWLDNLGMQEPKTIDDFYNMLKAFTTKDPDKNGKNDTYGMVISKYTGPFDIMQTWFGVPNKWGTDESGKLIPAHYTPEYMEALKFFKKLYDEKLINADFAVMDSNKWTDPIVNGQAGVIVDVTDNAARIDEKIHKALEQAGKDDKNKYFMDILGSVAGPKGNRALPTSGYAGMLAISKSTVKTEAELRQVLAFLDKLNDETAQNLGFNGIEGKHYKKVEGGIEPAKDTTLMDQELSGLNQMFMGIPENRYLEVVQTPVRIKSNEVQKANESIVVANPAEPLVSNVYAQKGPQLDNIINDARTKFIVGQIDEAGFKAAVELWKKSGGDDYVKEINDLYQASKK
ncbi:extracellular solute-binding protein [Paenibacillus doosanensis]|uniref:extracellular solute-binding protein n=1 Tax=Paenibacillus doosanensis TaxID=1229154 RepID=UPI00217FDDC3|nr:extracellular solute-binding protein [Paenibacillus doosanensis]MCS7462599.1 extracellular solute-binding protein [Paenibacillus doosanensis]